MYCPHQGHLEPIWSESYVICWWTAYTHSLKIRCTLFPVAGRCVSQPVVKQRMPFNKRIALHYIFACRWHQKNSFVSTLRWSVVESITWNDIGQHCQWPEPPIHKHNHQPLASRPTSCIYNTIFHHHQPFANPTINSFFTPTACGNGITSYTYIMYDGSQLPSHSFFFSCSNESLGTNTIYGMYAKCAVGEYWIENIWMDIMSVGGMCSWVYALGTCVITFENWIMQQVNNIFSSRTMKARVRPVAGSNKQFWKDKYWSGIRVTHCRLLTHSWQFNELFRLKEFRSLCAVFLFMIFLFVRFVSFVAAWSSFIHNSCFIIFSVLFR